MTIMMLMMMVFAKAHCPESIRRCRTAEPTKPLTTLAWPNNSLDARLAFSRGRLRVIALPAALNSRSSEAVDGGMEHIHMATTAIIGICQA